MITPGLLTPTNKAEQATNGEWVDRLSAVKWVNTTEPRNGTECVIDHTATAVINLVQVAVSFSGFVANILTFVTLWRSGEKISNVLCLILRHLAAVDACACFIAGTYSVLPPKMWSWHHYHLDLATCYCWHSQLIFSVVIFISVWNLVVVAFERYVAVCHPLHRACVSYRDIRCALSLIYVAGTVFQLPTAFQVRFTQGQCLPMLYFAGSYEFFYAYSIWCLFSFYIVPLLILSVLYGRVVTTLRRRNSSTTMQPSNVIDAANASLMRTAAVVMSVFAVTIGIERIYSLLGRVGLARHVLGTPMQKATMLITAFNSVMNPFIYCLMMPWFRLNLKTTFCCTSSRRRETDTMLVSAVGINVTGISNKGNTPSELSQNSIAKATDVKLYDAS